MAPVVLAIWGFGGVYDYVWVPVDLLAFAGCAILIWRQALQLQPVRFHPVYAPMLGWFVLVLLQWKLHWSLYPGVTLTGLVELAGCGCVFYLGYHAGASRRQLQRMGWLLWALCGLLALEALFQFFGTRGYIYGFHNATYASPVGPFVYHNHFAGCMDLLLPIAVAMAIRKDASIEPLWTRWLRRGLFPALGIAAMVISLSRGGMIALAFELVLGILIFGPELRHRKRAWISALAGLVLIAGFGLMANIHPFLQRFEQLSDHNASLESRLMVARTCLDIFRQHPWVGTGFNTFASVYPAHQVFDEGVIWQSAHNDYAQMLAETGTAGAICVAGFLLAVLVGLWRCWRRSPPDAAAAGRRRLQLAAFIAMGGFLLHSYGDFEFHDPANALLFFLVSAIALARAGHRPATDRHLPDRGTPA